MTLAPSRVMDSTGWYESPIPLFLFFPNLTKQLAKDDSYQASKEDSRPESAFLTSDEETEVYITYIKANKLSQDNTRPLDPARTE